MNESRAGDTSEHLDDLMQMPGGSGLVGDSGEGRYVPLILRPDYEKVPVYGDGVKLLADYKFPAGGGFDQSSDLEVKVQAPVHKSQRKLADALGMNANFEHFGADMYNSVWGSDFPGNFEAHAGSMWEQIGVREVGTHNGLFFRNPTSFLNIFEIHGGMKFHFDDEWRSEEEYFWTSVEGASDIIWSKLSYNWNHEIVNEKDLKFGSSTLESWGNPWSNLEYYGSLTLGNAPCYDEGITGWRSRVIGGLALKPVPNLVYNFNLTREDFYREYEGPLKYIQTVAWNKLSFQVRSAMFLRGIYQYNRLVQYGEETTGNSASILFEWEYSPLSNLYIGTNFLDFAELKDLTGSWEVFLKLGYFWRP